MKFILVFTVFVCAVSSKKIPPSLVIAWNNLVEPYRTKCIEETKVDPDIASNVFNRNEFPDEKKISCYFKCLHENLNNYGPNGELDGDSIAKTIDHVTPEIAYTCLDKFESETDSCTKSYKLSTCLVEANLID